MLKTPHYLTSFMTEQELNLSNAFLSKGHVIQAAEDLSAVNKIQVELARLAAEFLKITPKEELKDFLDHIHRYVDIKDLNAMRLFVINKINQCTWLRPCLYQLAKNTLWSLVGNELTMQRTINLSIQLPGDDNSLLEVHADSWAGDSPYEVVLWVPFVNCYGTKTMYLMNAEKDREYQTHFRSFTKMSSEELFKAIEPDVTFLNVPYGSFLLFCQNIMHGNRMNQELETRWSMNCRFKALTSPYGLKKHGEYFEPIHLKAATRLGLCHHFPEGFYDDKTT